MPLDTSPPLSVRPCDSTPRDCLPTATVPSGVMRAHRRGADDLRLELLPTEILVRIAGYLRPNAALALGRACWPIFEALRRDVIEPLRLGERIRWINSLTGVQGAIRGVLAAPADSRPALFHAVAQRAQALHPLLTEPSGELLARQLQACARPWWDELYAAEDPARERLAQARSCTEAHGELLERVLASPPETRVRLLLRWFGTAGTPLPTVGQWSRIVSALPPNARGRMLALMANGIPKQEAEYAHAQAIVLAAVRNSAAAGMPLPEDHANVLANLAKRLVWDAPRDQAARLAQAWDEIESLTRRLPLPAQRNVLAELTEFVHRDDADPADRPAQLATRWQAFIGYVGSHLPPADVAMILGRLAEHNRLEDYGLDDDDEAEANQLERPIREAIAQAAQALPGEWRVTLLARVLRYTPPDDPGMAARWDQVFVAAAAVPPEHAVAVYSDLANVVACLPIDIQENRWHALAHCAETAVNPGAMLPVLLELASHGLAPLPPQRHAALVRIGVRLPVEERGRLSAAMATTRDITPHRWRMQIAELEDLPRAARRMLASKLATVLFDYPAQGVFVQASDDVAADPGELLCARMPRTLAEALNALSEMLTLLPLAHRGAVLLSLSPMQGRWGAEQWSVPRARWLLEEALKLAPLQHHGIGIVANVLRAVALRCRNEADARALLPLLESAVRALPADARASSSFMLSSLIERLLKDQPSRDRWLAEMWALPAEDVAVATGSRKRKGAPQ